MKTYKLYLNIYDFMAINRCLEAIGMGAFHTGIEIGYLLLHIAIFSTATVCAPLIPKIQEFLKCSPRELTTLLTENYTWVKLQL